MGYKLTCDDCGCDVDADVDLVGQRAFCSEKKDGSVITLDVKIVFERNVRSSLSVGEKPALCLSCFEKVVVESVAITKGFQDV